MRTNDDSTSTDAATALGAARAPALGTVIDSRYRIVRAIGSGGMGAVFEAEHVSLGRRYAIKFVRSDLAGQPRSAERFEREARLLSRLEHDQLAMVIDAGVHHGNLPFLVMEFLEGSTLRDLLLERGRLPTGLAIELLLQAARGMAYVHARGIVHRDLKPSNLMLTARSDGRVWLKILDFGIARDIGEVEGLLTPSGVELGTAQYMSPEQARGAKDIDARSDVYALGGIIYEVLSGERAHVGDSYNAVIFHLLTQAPRPLAQLAPDCPDDVVAIVERCLEKDATRRYPNAQALVEALLARGASSGESKHARQAVASSPGARRLKASWFAAGVAAGGVAMAAVGALRTYREAAVWTSRSGAPAIATERERQLEVITLSSAPGDKPPTSASPTVLSPTPPAMAAAAPGARGGRTEKQALRRASSDTPRPQQRPARFVRQAEHAGALTPESQAIPDVSKRGSATSREAPDGAGVLAASSPAQVAGTRPSLRLVTTNPYDVSP